MARHSVSDIVMMVCGKGLLSGCFDRGVKAALISAVPSLTRPEYIQRLERGSCLDMTSVLLRGYNVLPHTKLHLSLWAKHLLGGLKRTSRT